MIKVQAKEYNAIQSAHLQCKINFNVEYFMELKGTLLFLFELQSVKPTYVGGDFRTTNYYTVIFLYPDSACALDFMSDNDKAAVYSQLYNIISFKCQYTNEIAETRSRK